METTLATALATAQLPNFQGVPYGEVKREVSREVKSQTSYLRRFD